MRHSSTWNGVQTQIFPHVWVPIEHLSGPSRFRDFSDVPRAPDRVAAFVSALGRMRERRTAPQWYAARIHYWLFGIIGPRVHERLRFPRELRPSHLETEIFVAHHHLRFADHDDAVRLAPQAA